MSLDAYDGKKDFMNLRDKLYPGKLKYGDIIDLTAYEITNKDHTTSEALISKAFTVAVIWTGTSGDKDSEVYYIYPKDKATITEEIGTG